MKDLKLRTLRKVLEEAISNIDAGNSNHDEKELDEIIKFMTKLNRGVKCIAKAMECLEDMRGGNSYHERYGNREDDMDDDNDELYSGSRLDNRYGNRYSRRRGMGRYSRY